MAIATSSEPITFEDFLKVDIRVGTIIEARLNEKAIKPALALKIDFGPMGVKESSAQLTQHYATENLVGQKIAAVCNFPPKKIAGIDSEVLVLAVVCEVYGTVLLAPIGQVENGSRVL